jgi:type VI secretion system secreted protein VgrG
MTDPLTKVKLSFNSAGETASVWRVVRLHGREALSELFSFVIDLANEDLTADPDRLLGKTAQLELSRDAQVRRVSGVAHRVEHRGTTAGHVLCRVHLAPALLALSQRVNSRMFQEKTAPDILKLIFDEGLGPWQKSHRMDLARTYPKREYCLQHRESDLEFALRLMSEEGIAFYFDFSDTHDEVLVLVDANEPYTPVTTLDGAAVPIMGDEGGTADIETVRHFDLVHQLRTTSVVVRDFDWTQPMLDLTRESRAQDPNGMDRESFEYPAPLTLSEYSNPQYGAEDGAAQARLRRESHAVTEKRYEGDGYVSGFTPGYTFELSGHGNAGFDGEYLVTRVEHRGYAPEQLTNDTAGAAEIPAHERYHNQFECVPRSVVFRPARTTQRPKVSGIQTATVVGPAGEEIYTDEHGRIKVQLHWDREGQRDEHSSCWIRVMQPWAGAGWGFVWIPRIGMEVVVQFLEGNPDRPLVTGCVYNGQNTPPYPLPDEKTKSTIKSNSTPGGGGSNEIRFEDAAGSEEVYLHAQKDLNEVVEHDHNTTVHNNHTNTVDVNDTESVGGDQSLSVSGNRTKTVDKDEKTTVHKNRTEVVDIDETITVHGKRTEIVDGDETLTVHSARTTTIHTGDTLTVDTGNHAVTVSAGNDTLTVTGNKTDHITANYTVTADAQFQVTQGSITLNIQDLVDLTTGGKKVTATNGPSTITMDGGKITLNAASEVAITCGAASISLKSDGTVAIQGAKEVGAGSGASAIKVDPSGVTSSGPKITSSAIGVHEISGALIKIN